MSKLFGAPISGPRTTVDVLVLGAGIGVVQRCGAGHV